MGQAVPVTRAGWCESCGGCVEEGVGQRLGVGGACAGREQCLG